MSDEEYMELTGDDLPYHLRDDAAPLAVCDRCGRKSWSADEIDTTDKMPQPNGEQCGGHFSSRVLPESARDQGGDPQ